MCKEYWKPVVGYEQFYMVSNYGNVMSIKTGKILKKSIVCGYYKVNLSKNGIVKGVRVHRLVVLAFLKNEHNYQLVNHKDEDKLNNFVWVNDDGTVDPEKSNLEWCDTKYNRFYGSIKPQKVYVYQNNELIGIFESQHLASRVLSIDQGNISACCNGRIKSHKGMVFKYQDCIDDIPLSSDRM